MTRRSLVRIGAATLAAAAIGGRPAIGLRDGTSGGDALQSLIDRAAVGSRVSVRGTWTRDVPLVLSHPVTVDFTDGAIRMASDADALQVVSSDVRVIEPTIIGNGAETGGLGRGIAVLGSPAAPLCSVRIDGGAISDVPHDGIYMAYCDEFAIVGTTVERTGYSGVQVVGGVDGVVQDLVVSDIRQPVGRPNSYGITITRDATASTAECRRSARVRVLRNRVTDVRHWEGIDTHAGESIEIRDNVITGCAVGIAAVPSKDPDDRTDTAYAPVDLAISGNTIRKSSEGIDGPGILVSGAGTTVDSDRERATGVVQDNTVEGCGGGRNNGAVAVKLSGDLRIEGNRISASRTSAVALLHSNRDVRLVRNSVVGVGGADRLGVNVIDGANTGSIERNEFASEPTPLRVAVRFGPQPNRFRLSENVFGDAETTVAPGGATLTRLASDEHQ